MGERGVELAVANPRQARACGPAYAHSGETLLGVAGVAPELLDDETLDEGQAGGVQCAVFGQDLGHGSVPGLRPGMEGGEELRLIDQAGLQREQTEKEIARGIQRVRHDDRLRIKTSGRLSRSRAKK